MRMPLKAGSQRETRARSAQPGTQADGIRAKEEPAFCLRSFILHKPPPELASFLGRCGRRYNVVLRQDVAQHPIRKFTHCIGACNESLFAREKAEKTVVLGNCREICVRVGRVSGHPGPGEEPAPGESAELQHRFSPLRLFVQAVQHLRLRHDYILVPADEQGGTLAHRISFQY
jgi:hypothetical protein